MIRTMRLLFTTALIVAVFLAGPALAAQKHHQSGDALLGGKIHQNGKHAIHTHGKHTVSATVVNGKVSGLSVNHKDKGAVAVTKYKSDKKVAQAGSRYFVMADTGTLTDATVAQLQYVTEWVAYAYYDEYGDQYFYWFPVDMIIDGDTGAILYIY